MHLPVHNLLRAVLLVRFYPPDRELKHLIAESGKKASAEKLGNIVRIYQDVENNLNIAIGLVAAMFFAANYFLRQRQFQSRSAPVSR